MKYVFVALLEVRPLDGCQLDPAVYAGARVRCYIPAEDEEGARDLLFNTLERNGFEFVDVEFFVRDDLAEWEFPDNEDGAKAVAEALETGEVVYSEFWAWDHDDPDARKDPKETKPLPKSRERP